MAKYRITGPDGQQYDITAPDDATEDQVLAYAQQNYQAPAQPKASPQDLQAKMIAGDQAAGDEFKARYKAMTGDDYVPQTGAESADGSIGGANFKAAMGSTLGDTGNGIMQNAIEGGPVGNMVRAGFNAVGIQQPKNPMQEWIQNRIAEKRTLDAPLQQSEGGTRGAIAGNMLQLASPGAVSKLAAIKYPQLAGVASGMAPTSYVGNAAMGAVMGALQPRVAGENQAINMVTGGLFGAGGRAVAGGLANVVNGASQKLSTEVAKLYQTAKAAGIPIHWSQLTDSKFAKTLSSIAGGLPFSGAGNAVKAQKEKFIAALGETFGLKGVTNLDDTAMQNAGKAISDKYTEVYGRNSIKADAQLFVKLGVIKKKIGEDLTSDNAKVALNQINKIVNELKSGAMTGKKYQNLRGDLADIIASNEGNTLGAAVKQVRKALDATAQRSIGPEDSKIIAEANKQWANYRLVEKALKQVAGSKGEVNPANMWNMVKNGSTKEMRELGKVGQFIKDPIPDSGTAGRLLTAGLTGGAAFGGTPALAGAAALVGTGATLGRALNSPRFGRYMAEGLGPNASKVAEGVGTVAKLISTGSSSRATPALQQLASRSVEIRQAAMNQPERGPEILSGLPPVEQIAAAKEFADANGLSVKEVLQKMQAENKRVKQLLAR